MNGMSEGDNHEYVGEDEAGQKYAEEYSKYGRFPRESPKVYSAINKVTKALSHEGIAKDKKNTQQGYNFRGIDDMYNALSAVLAGANLCILPCVLSRTQEERTTKDGKGTLFSVVLQIRFDFVSSEDGSCHPVVMFGEAMDSGDKATNKAMSAAFKYACMQTFCIPTEGMEDADSSTHEVAPKGTPVHVPQTKPYNPPADKSAPVAKPAAAKASTANSDLSGLIQSTAENWLKKFMDLGHPEIFKRSLGSHGAAQISEIPINHAKAKAIFDELGELYRDAKARKTAAITAAAKI
jgi:hypothetical protein